MAFITLEDMVGSVEVIVFPKAYEANASKLNPDAKVFIKGRVSVEEDRDAKLIANTVTTFDEMPKTVWLRFPDMAAYEKAAARIDSIIAESDGTDEIAVFLEETRQVKKYGKAKSVQADKVFLDELRSAFGAENIKVQ